MGHESSDDAAVYDLGDGRALISTTDFFMPIVDDPFHFGMIAGSNALSDVYAMGGKPLMAISIFGWPINLLSAEIGAKVIDGGREICNRAGIALAGGHSIDSPEPIFGLSVSGIVEIKNLKKNFNDWKKVNGDVENIIINKSGVDTTAGGVSSGQNADFQKLDFGS